jgi:hypothetical protein
MAAKSPHTDKRSKVVGSLLDGLHQTTRLIQPADAAKLVFGLGNGQGLVCGPSGSIAYHL